MFFMDNNNQLVPQPNQKKTSKILKLLAIVFVLLIIAGGLTYGGYYIGSQNTKVSHTPVDQTTSAPKPAFHTILSVGYVGDQPTKLTSMLAIPNRLQAIAVSSGGQDPGYTDILATNYGAEMGRWKIGDPTLTNGYFGDISLINIQDKWLQQTSPAPEGPDYLLGGLDFTTPAKKTASLASMEQQAKNCSGPTEKAFTISNVLKVCATPILIRQSIGAYGPQLYLKGYGIIDGQIYVLLGSLSLSDGTKYSEDEADKKATSFQVHAIPAETQKLINEDVDALKMSTITVSAR